MSDGIDTVPADVALGDDINWVENQISIKRKDVRRLSSIHLGLPQDDWISAELYICQLALDQLMSTLGGLQAQRYTKP